MSTSDVARRYDLSPQQLFQWRRQARQGALVVPMAEAMMFAQVCIEPAPAAGRALEREGLEVTVAGASIRVCAATDLGLLARVVRALSGERA